MMVGCCFLAATLLTRNAPADELWDYGDIRHYYAYDNTLPLEASLVSEEKKGRSIERVVRLRAADGEWMTTTLHVPEGKGPFSLFLGQDAAAGGRQALADAGYLCAEIDRRLSGDRKRPGLSMSLGENFMLSVWSRQQMGVDYRRLMDYLFREYRIDPDRTVIAGTSRMGRISVITAACDERIKAVIARSCCADWSKLISGPGGNPALAHFAEEPWYDQPFFRRLTASIDPLHYGKWMKGRLVLVQSGEDDTEVPSLAARRLADVLKDSATFRTYPGQGHRLLGEAVIADAQAWLDNNGLW
ncbi:MAG: prolyl oligopeptidase family serine peptidase [Planctomycetota bacterium]